jgi:hypothetical protein
MTKDPLVKVYQAQGIFAAEVIKAKLEANDIPALLKYEAIGQIIGITVDGLGRVEVFVAAEHAPEALRLIEERDEEAGEPYDSDETADVPAADLSAASDTVTDEKE